MINRITSQFNCNTAKVFWAVYFLLVCLPLHASNNFLEWVTIGSSYTIFHIVLLLLLVYLAIKSSNNALNRKITLVGICIACLWLSTLVAFIIGYQKGYEVVFDLGRYLLMLLILSLTRSNAISCIGVSSFLLLSSIAMIINCAINCIMNLSNWQFWGLSAFGSESQLGGGYYSLLALILPYCLYCALQGNKGLKWSHFWVLLLVSLICMAYYKSRTVVIIAALLCIVVLIVFAADFGSRQFSYRLLLLMGIPAVVLLIIAAFFASGLDSSFIERISNTSISIGTDETIGTRLITAQYYGNMILSNPLGEGLGFHMVNFYSEGIIDYATESVEIDNAFVTLGVHLGLAGLLFYIVLTVIVPVMKLTQFEDKRYGLLLMLFYLGLLICVGVMTSQMIHSYSVVAFVGAFIGVISSDDNGCSEFREAEPIQETVYDSNE